MESNAKHKNNPQKKINENKRQSNRKMGKDLNRQLTKKVNTGFNFTRHQGKKMKLSNDYSWKNSEVSGSFLCLWLASTPAVTLALRVSVVCVGWGSGKGGGCSSLWMSLAAAGRPSL